MIESKAEKETCTFKNLKAFEELSSNLERKYNIRIHLAKTVGNRWSYHAGKKLKEIPEQVPLRVRLSEEWGLIIYSNKDFSFKEEEIILLKKYLLTFALPIKRRKSIIGLPSLMERPLAVPLKKEETDKINP